MKEAMLMFYRAFPITTTIHLLALAIQLIAMILHGLAVTDHSILDYSTPACFTMAVWTPIWVNVCIATGHTEL